MPLISVADPSNIKGSVVVDPTATTPVSATSEPSVHPTANPTSAVTAVAQVQPMTINPEEVISLGVEGVKEVTLPLKQPEVVEPPKDLSKELDNKLDNLTNFIEPQINNSIEDKPSVSDIVNPPIDIAAEELAQPTQNSQVDSNGVDTMSDLVRVDPLQLPSLDELNFQNVDLPALLRYAISQKASDLHLTVGYRPMLRIDGNLKLATSSVLTTSQINQYVLELIKTRKSLTIDSIYEADLTHEFEGRRFRVNIFKQMGNFSIVMRVISDKILTVDELGLPPIIKTFSHFPNGLVLMTGPTGSGKSTTIASVLNLINLTTPKHIITLEDPVEFIFPKGLGLVDQREYNVDFLAWDLALRSVLRQDPDVVLVGEMRDLETVEAALQIAETGHLVFATLHTNGATETINRIIDIFSNEKQDQIRIQLSSVLRAVISQRLIPSLKGNRVVASEIMINNPGIQNAIRDKKVFQIDNVIQTSTEAGMISLERSLVNLIRQGIISTDVAKSVSKNPHDVEILLKQ